MLSWRSALRDEKTERPAPGPTPLPLLGNTLSLRRAYYRTLYQYVEEPASVFWVLSTPFVVVNDEQGLRRVLGGANGTYAKPRYFGYRSRAVASAVAARQVQVARESLAYDDDGDASRKALSAMVRAALPHIADAACSLLRAIEAESCAAAAAAGAVAADGGGGVRDAAGVVRRTLVALNLRVLFGVRDGEKGVSCAAVADAIGRAGAEFARRMVNPLRVWWALWANVRFARDVAMLIGLGRRLGKALDDAARDVEAERAAAGVSWVHAWVGKVGVVGKLGKVVGLLMASSQTVPLTVVWALHLLGTHADALRKVRDELVREGVRDVHDVTLETLERLSYLDAVCKEALRLYPPFPLVQRQAQRDDVLGGVRIPRGGLVYVVPWLVHRNERFFAAAHEFRPERFVDGSADFGDAPSAWVYVPFARGGRMCAGSALAMAELKVVLMHAALEYEWTSWREGGDEDARFPQLGMVPGNIRMRFRGAAGGEEANGDL